MTQKTPASCTSCDCETKKTGGRSWLQTGGTMFFVLIIYLVLRKYGVVALTPSMEGAVGLGTVFVVGLVAATSSCLAVVGGLLLSVSAKYAEAFQPDTRWEKFRPLMLFNIGRLGGYFVLGGVAGLLGKSLALSPYSTGILTIIIAFVMIMLGLNILRILPKQYCRLPLPRSLTQRIHRLSQSRNAAAPLLLGSLTFFLPCGFTQSMQLLALGSGSFIAGGLIMLVFALGTLPALLGISVVSSVIEGKPAQWFLSFSGAVVLLLGVFNLQSGFLLTGHDLLGFLHDPVVAPIAEAGNDPYVTIDRQGRQIMSMYVTDRGYSPNNFTIRPGMETWVYAISPNGVSGCLSSLVDSTHNLQTPIKKGDNWLGPISSLPGGSSFLLTCSMGMFKANVHVI